MSSDSGNKSDPNPVNKRRQPLTYNEIRDRVAKQINEAVERGDFDNLPLEGKKLNLEGNPLAPPEWQLAFKVLKDNQVVPEFVERRKKIEDIRNEMKETEGEHALRRLAERLAAEVEALNRCVVRENEFVRTSLQMAPVDVESEVRKYLH